jgi:ABC-type transport system involved in multi-copper enzyme maturation permease subunit
MNPVLRKDILGLLRLARIAAVFVVFVGLLSTLVLATWPQQGLVALATKGQDNLLLGLVMGQLLLLILAVPGVASVQLTEEKEGNTLEMLYATRLSPISIVLGKLGSAVAFPVMLLLAGLPFLALLNYRGDVDQWQIIQAYAVLIVTAVLLALLSLAISALCKTSATALVVAYLLVLFICGAVLVPALIMLDVQEDPTMRQGLHYLRSISPVAAAMSILRPAINGFGGGETELPAWVVFFGFSTVLIVGSAIIVASKLSRPPIQAERGGAPVSDEARTLGRKLMFLIDDKKQRKPIGSFNPLIAKEKRTNQVRSGKWMIRIFYGAAVLGLLLSLMALLGGSEHENVLSYVATVIASLQFAVLALVTPSLASPVISSEREADTFEMLRMTRLGGGKIFWGKFIPAFLPALLPVIAMVPAWGVVSFVNESYINYAIQLAPVTLLAVLMCSTIALACSALFASSARATVIAYMVVAAIFIVPVLAWWVGGSLLAAPVAARIAMVSPLAIALDLRPGQNAVALTSGLINQHLIAVGAISVLALIVARVRLAQLMRQG